MKKIDTLSSFICLLTFSFHKMQFQVLYFGVWTISPEENWSPNNCPQVKLSPRRIAVKDNCPRRKSPPGKLSLDECPQIIAYCYLKDNCPLKISPWKFSPKKIAFRMICCLRSCPEKSCPSRKIVPRINYTRWIFS